MRAWGVPRDRLSTVLDGNPGRGFIPRKGSLVVRLPRIARTSRAQAFVEEGLADIEEARWSAFVAWLATDMADAAYWQRRSEERCPALPGGPEWDYWYMAGGAAFYPERKWD